MDSRGGGSESSVGKQAAWGRMISVGVTWDRENLCRLPSHHAILIVHAAS